MIEPTEMFICTCDNCGETYGTPDFDTLVMPDESSMKETMGDDGDWYTEKGNPDKHYCPDCFRFDDNDNFIVIPKSKS